MTCDVGNRFPVPAKNGLELVRPGLLDAMLADEDIPDGEVLPPAGMLGVLGF